MLNLNGGFRSLAIGSVLTMAMGAMAAPASPSSQKNSPTDPSLKKRMLRHEAKFFENKGQWDHRGQFLTRRPGLDWWMESRGIDFEYYQTGGTHNHPTKTGQTVAMHFVGSGSNLKFEGVRPTGAINDYLFGKKQVRGARGFAEVRSRQVFPGIDFRGYYQEDSPRYDFIVAPHANPASIDLRYDGADKVAVNSSGVELTTRLGEKLQGDLHAYQTIGGHRVQVPAAFKLVAKNEVRLSVGAYDKSKTLVIDPLVYGTYVGGDGGFDEVRSVVADSATDGAVYLTGDTASSLFPVTAGPFFFNLKGLQNAFIVRLQGDAFNFDYSAFVGGSIVDTGQFLKLDPHGNVIMAGTSTSSDFPGSIRDNKILLTGDPTATGGQFVLTNGFSESEALPYNVPLYVGNVRPSLANLNPLWRNALEAVGVYPYLDPSSPPSNPGNLPLNFGGNFEFDFKPDLPGYPFGIISTRIGDNTGEFSSGLPFIVVNYYQTDQNGYTTADNLTPEASAATGGAFSLTFQPAGGTGQATTTALSLESSATEIQAALQKLANIGQLTAVVTDLGPGNTSAASDGTMATDIMQVQFTLKGVVQSEPPLIVNDIGWSPTPSYSVNLYPYVWAYAFQPTGTTLTPINNCEESFGTAFGTELDGFDVKQVANASASLADDLVFAGNTSFQIPEFAAVPYDSTTDGTQKGFMVRLGFKPFGANTTNYTLTTGASSYITSSFPVSSRGVVLDASGSAYTVGTVYGQGNTDTSINPAAFTTTAGVFVNGTFSSAANGRHLRNADIFVRKYSPNSNAIAWSGLLGGTANDFAGGWFYDLDGSDVATGSAIALDAASNVYVTGLSQSYDFPRTRGVYGEDFTDADAVSVTKITNDGSDVVYSTNLNSSGLYISAGIAIDELGDAVVTGNTVPLETFPENIGQMPGDPDQPTSTNYGIIGTTPDAFAGTFGGPTAPAIGTISAWVNVISPDATSLVYGSYLGGVLNNRVYAPYVDAFGDTWLFGWVETYRNYTVYSSTGTATTYNQASGLPGSMVSPNAFKNYPDEGQLTALDQTAYGFWDAYGFTVAPLYIPTYTDRDGWVVKLRIGLPSVQSLTFNPATVPGGFGTTSTGTVTLTTAAPANGALVNLSIVTGSGASFSSTSSLGTYQITIPSGGTTGTFTVYTSPVSAVSPVTFTANYLGSYQSATLNVEPYLGGFSLSPSTVVGGNQTTGTITLIQPAPASGVTVTLSTPNSKYLSFPNGTSVVVPAGQTTAAVTINTVGVAVPTQVSVSAAISSYSISQPLTITQATLASLSFSPTTISDGNSATGTVTLNGQAGMKLTIAISSAGGGALPAGVTITPSTTLTIPTGLHSASFTVNVPAASVDRLTSLTLQATMGAKQAPLTNYPTSTAVGTLSVQPNSIASFTVSSSSLQSGGIATGTVTIASPAPASGLNLSVSGSPSGVLQFYTGTNPPTNTLILNIPGGATTATFSIVAGFATSNTPVTITVSKPGQSLTQKITVVQTGSGLTLVPSEVTGGISASGFLTLAYPTPKALTFTVTAPRISGPTPAPALTVPATITVPAGGTTSNTFTIGTKAVSAQTVYSVTATYGAYSTSAPLTVDEVSIASVTVSPAAFHSVVESTTCTITLTGPAPAGGLVINLSQDQRSLHFPSSSITIPAGATTYTVHSITASEVSRDIDETITATTADQYSSGSATVKIEVP